jgi:hypothetical protein
MILYSWKDYKCTLCKESFNGKQLFKVPTGWGYELPMCKPCYRGAK